MNIKLFPIDNVEIDLLQKWQNDVNIKYPLMGFRFPIQKKSIEKWLNDIRKENGSNRVIYAIFVNEVALGMVSLHGIDYINSKAFFGIYVTGEKNNKGIGFAATQLTLDFAFNAMGLNRVELEVLISNKNAIHLYRRIGFKDEGIKRKSFFADDKFMDVQIMSILKNEFIFDNTLLSSRLVLDF